MGSVPNENSRATKRCPGSVPVGVVAIGRNEGERLRRCLESVLMQADLVVYVDSGSTDESVTLAKVNGVSVVSLDMNIPFTAARARNAGFERLTKLQPTIEFVQFVDGDCEIDPAWIDTAVKVLEEHPEVVVVCGRRRERAASGSIYNRLMDMEWNTLIGEAEACGGDSLMRVDALRRINGFDPTMIAGEEPELCLRLRREGGRILRIDADMTDHDAAMMRFSQWWNRTIRNGYAYAVGAGKHRGSPERHWVRDNQRIVFWGLLLPVFSVGFAPWTSMWSLSASLLYPVWAIRVARYRMQAYRDPMPHALLYGVFCMLGRFPQFLGLLRYRYHRLRGRAGTLIEYK